MVSVAAGSNTHLHIVGHGLAIDGEFTLDEGVIVTSEIPEGRNSFGSTVGQMPVDAALLVMEGMASFSLRIEHPDGGEKLAARGWNALWLFNLLALAVRQPVFSLYSYAPGAGYQLANRNLVITRLPEVVLTGNLSLAWAANQIGRYKALIGDPKFQAAQRYFSNAYYLFDDEVKVMLLWAGIEGLLGVDSEISRRLALHAAILLDGDAEAKARCYTDVKKAYGVRSKIVHGGKVSREDCSAGTAFANTLLQSLLRKVVELGRIPSTAEFDRLAASASVLA